MGQKTYSCPLLLSLDLISGKWKGIILWFLLQETTLRFGELKKKIHESVKITDKMLIQSLRELEDSGLVKRKVYQVVPPKVEYSPSDQGKELQPLFDQLIHLGLKYQV